MIYGTYWPHGWCDQPLEKLVIGRVIENFIFRARR
jgi:hypothetical protein